MPNLYEINHDYLSILRQAEKEANENDGEISEITSQYLDQSSLTRNEKIENTALYIKNRRAYYDALKAESEMFKNRAVTVENDIKRCKTYLKNALNGEKFETTKCKISFRSTKSVNVTVDPKKLPWEYFNIKTEYKPDKKKISDKIKSLKEGEVFNGAEIVINRSIQIK